MLCALTVMFESIRNYHREISGANSRRRVSSDLEGNVICALCSLLYYLTTRSVRFSFTFNFWYTGIFNIFKSDPLRYRLQIFCTLTLALHLRTTTALVWILKTKRFVSLLLFFSQVSCSRIKYFWCVLQTCDRNTVKYIISIMSSNVHI